MTCSPIPFTDIGNVLVCTSSTRPTGDQRYTGRVIFETDTGKLRTWSGAAWVGNGTEGYAQVTSSQTGVTSATDITGLVVNWTAAAGRRYRVSVEAYVSVSSSGATVSIAIADGFSTQLTSGQCDVPVSGRDQRLHVSHVYVPGAGATSAKARLALAGGAGTVGISAGAMFPAYILVEDIT